MSARLPIAVVCTPGLEFTTHRELASLGVAPVASRGDQGAGPGVIECETDIAGLYGLNLHLRTAARVLVRLGAFNAAAFSELRKKASRLPWSEFLAPGRPVGIRVATHASRLYHKKGIAERMAGAIADALGQESPLRNAESEDDGSGEVQWIFVRIVRDFCRISIDSSGEHLHRRGYRLQTAKAPIRENLAAFMLIASGWPGTCPLIDPFCGSGTLPIEAARIAAGIPSGWNRRFAFEQWPGFDASCWRSVREAAKPSPRAMPVLIGSDRDAGAVRAAEANAARAGVGDVIQWICRSISDLAVPEQPGWIVTNPPYGERVTGGPDLRNLYARMGSVWRTLDPMWHIFLLTSSPKWSGQLGLAVEECARFDNGGIGVALLRARLPER